MAEMQRVTELGFADFVAMLLVETLDAIVASHTSQEERLRALRTAAEQDLETFAGNITDEVLEATLARLFPGTDGGTALIEGGGAPSLEVLRDLGITLSRAATTSGRLTAAGVSEIRAGVRRHLALTHQQSLREVAREGVPKVFVDGGVLRSKLTFSAVRREKPSTGSGERSAAPATSQPVAVDPAIIAELPTRYLPVLQRGVIDSIASTRLTVAPARPATPAGEETPAGESSATIYGEVEIHFHTER